MLHSLLPNIPLLGKHEKLPGGRRGGAATMVQNGATVLLGAQWNQVSPEQSRATATRFEENVLACHVQAATVLDSCTPGVHGLSGGRLLR